MDGVGLNNECRSDFLIFLPHAWVEVDEVDVTEEDGHYLRDV